jgi:hypothetical protein
VQNLYGGWAEGQLTCLMGLKDIALGEPTFYDIGPCMPAQIRRTTTRCFLLSANGTGELRFSDHIPVGDPAIINVIRDSLESNFFTLEHRNHAVQGLGIRLITPLLKQRDATLGQRKHAFAPIAETAAVTRAGVYAKPRILYVQTVFALSKMDATPEAEWPDLFTREEMLEHQSRLLIEECHLLQKELSRQRKNIAKLIGMHADATLERDKLRRLLSRTESQLFKRHEDPLPSLPNFSD